MLGYPSLPSVAFKWSKMRLPDYSQGVTNETISHQFYCTLHWLPVRYRIHYTILLFVYKALNNLAPMYLSDLLTTYKPARSLRSQDGHLLRIPRSRLQRRSDRAFAITGPKLWNSLPFSVRTASTLATFKSRLKMYLFFLVKSTHYASLHHSIKLN